MREIKFRGKRVDDGEWVYGGCFTTNIKTIIVFCDNNIPNKHNVKFYEVDPKTVGQYTGLKDKEGNEIYEGDICNAYKANSYLNGQYVVKWHESKGRWYYEDQPKYKDLYQVGCKGNLICYVKGNIYENPELL